VQETYFGIELVFIFRELMVLSHNINGPKKLGLSLI
jgi:hypothetical protein